MNHPNVNDSPQGTEVSWSEKDKEKVEGIIWTAYSPKTGEYNATIATFNVNKETKTLSLDTVIVRRVDDGWDNHFTDQASYVTDRMKRAVRKFIAKETGIKGKGGKGKRLAYWRVKL